MSNSQITDKPGSVSSLRSEEQIALLQTITLEVAAASDLPVALEMVLHRICEKTGWVLGQAWLPDPDETTLNVGPMWSCGNGELVDFRNASQTLRLEHGSGLPGRVWKSKKPVWIEDVTNDPNFPTSSSSAHGSL